MAPGILREEQPAQCSSHSVPECQMSSLQTISSWRPKASANSGDGSSHLCHVRERKALGSIAFGPDVGSVYCRKKTKGDLLAYSLHFSCACCRFWLIKQPPLLLLSASYSSHITGMQFLYTRLALLSDVWCGGSFTSPESVLKCHFLRGATCISQSSSRETEPQGYLYIQRFIARNWFM